MSERLLRKNLAEIESLNQRGGRTLTLVDLIAAGTLSVELVAHCWAAIARGASFLTAAGPGGVGKSTVLANLLALLPPEEEIVTVTDPQLISHQGPKCYLAHEIGSGHWYGYIWGREVPPFFGLMERGHRVASCLHADTLDQVRAILLNPPLCVPDGLLNRVGLILFVQALSGGRRRVTEAYEAAGSGHRLAFRWDRESDHIVRQGPSALLPLLGGSEAEYQQRLADVRAVVAEGGDRFEAVRRRILAAYGER